MSLDLNDEILAMTSDIVSAYVGSNSLSPDAIPALIANVHAALTGVAEGKPAPVEAVELVPAVPIRKSIAPDYIICLEDGKRFKSLKRHIRTRYNLSPEEYRVKWGLPSDYPMVAPNYARARSDLAKRMGLGQGRKA